MYRDPRTGAVLKQLVQSENGGVGGAVVSHRPIKAPMAHAPAKFLEGKLTYPLKQLLLQLPSGIQAARN